MKNYSTARRYARALYELAKVDKSLSDVRQGLSNIRTALGAAPELARALFNPLIRSEEKQAVLKHVTSNKLLLRFIGVLAERKRLDILPLVEEQLTMLCDKADGIHRILVRSAVPLTEELKKLIEQNVAKAVGGKVVGQFQVAKDLIGGVWMKMEDKILDLTLKGRIDDLRHALSHSAN